MVSTSRPGYFEGEFETESLESLEGSIGVKIYELGKAPLRIINADNPWAVEVYWALAGPLMPSLSGTWSVNVYLEAIGDGPNRFGLALAETVLDALALEFQVYTG